MLTRGHKRGRTVASRVQGIPRGPGELQRSLLALATLRRAGWFDRAGRVPWLTYPAIRFLEGLDTCKSSALEFGTGSSTRWLNSRFAEVLSVEHDPVWFAKADGAHILLRDPVGDQFLGQVDSPYLEAGRVDAPWDMVLIDGMSRVTCVEHVEEFVADDGLVVVDDTDLPQLQPARQALADKGFAAIDFWGFKRWVGLETCTSVYCRQFSRWLSPRGV